MAESEAIVLPPNTAKIIRYVTAKRAVITGLRYDNRSITRSIERRWLAGTCRAKDLWYFLDICEGVIKAHEKRRRGSKK